MKRNIQIITKIIIISSIVSLGFKVAANNDHSKCSSEWQKLGPVAYKKSDAELIEMWRNKKQSCLGSSFYDLKLAVLLTSQGSYAESEKILIDAINRKTDLDGDLRLELADLNFKRGIRENKDEYFKISESLLKGIIKDFPNWYGAYEVMSTLKMVVADFPASIIYGQKSVKRHPTAFAYRNLTISYNATENHPMAIESFKLAYDLDEYIIEDKSLMLTVATSYAELKKWELSRNSLAILMQKFPGIENDEDFKYTANHIKNKLKENGVTAISNSN